MKWVAAIALSVLGAASCAIFPAVGKLDERRLAIEWATSLYSLEPFAYHPTEEGRPLYVRSKDTPEAGLVVVPSKDRRVRGLDAASGRVVWEVETRGPNGARPVDLGPHGAAGEVMIASLDGRVYRLNQRNGREVWASQHPGTAGITESPTIAGRSGDPTARVFVTSLDDRLTALSFATGAKLWQVDRPQEQELTVTGQAGAAVAKDMVITGFSGGDLIAFAQEDGVTVWTADLAGTDKQFVDVDTTPQVVEVSEGHVVIAGSFSRGLFGVGLDDGVILWKQAGTGFQTPAVLDGIAYAPRTDGQLWAVEAESGRVRWVTKFDTGWAGTPVASRKYVLVPIGEALSLVDRGSGHEVVRWSDGRGVRATPELAFGSVYVIGNSGVAYGLGVF